MIEKLRGGSREAPRRLQRGSKEAPRRLRGGDEGAKAKLETCCIRIFAVMLTLTRIFMLLARILVILIVIFVIWYGFVDFGNDFGDLRWIWLILVLFLMI